MLEEYKKAIIEELENCKDWSILDLILKLLIKLKEEQ